MSLIFKHYDKGRSI